MYYEAIRNLYVSYHILNATSIAATEEQIAAGVVDFPEEMIPQLYQLLTFTTLPTVSDLCERADNLVDFINDYILEHEEITHVMINPPAFFTLYLAKELEYLDRDINVVYPFSHWVYDKVILPDSSNKETMNREEGFVGFKLVGI